MKTKEKKKTPKEKFKVFLKVLMIIVLVIIACFAVLAIISQIGIKSNENFISSISPVEYEVQLQPQLDDDGNYYFETDKDLKIMQLTDVHIGAGFMSTKKDALAINAVASMIKEEKPDLVVVTGDIAFPVPFQAGTFNNKSSAKLFAKLMDQLGVYWCLSFGNHDTEAYSYFSRKQISKFYENEKYRYCLFQEGSKDVDGYGNYVIKVKNTQGKITQALFMLDSHSYVDGDYFGILWKYDCIHENQIDWYENTLIEFQKQNNGEMPKSLCFFHIPLKEYQTAWYEYRDNGYKDTEDVKLIYGNAGESGNVVYSGEGNNGFFDKAKELGSTQGFFCGHDHLNNFSLEYKGIRLSYGYSIDYLAYSGISTQGLQRGCTVITVSPNGEFSSKLENYYQEKYQPEREKEQVTMDGNFSYSFSGLGNN